MVKPESWLRTTPQGLYCAPADLFVDPVRPAARAAITHGHGDHARPGNAKVLATPGTAAIMRTRYGADAATELQELPYGERLTLGEVTLWFAPAGHVFGSAQLVLEYRGARVVVSGDYKRRRDPTCPPFEPVACDLFVTEATFGLPVFRHPPDQGEIGKVFDSLRLFPDSAHLIGAYALGKAQRVLSLLREGGWERPIWLHGALLPLTELYRAHGLDFGDLRPASAATRDELKGQIVLAPPGALTDRWSRRLPEVVPAVASGWMSVRARARQSAAELPLIISDHADWDELLQTLRDVQAPRVWVTHGREEALVHAARAMGIEAEALSLVGYEDEAQ